MYGGDKTDSVCDKNGACEEFDTRIRFPFEMQWIKDKAYMEFGWFNAYDSEASYAHVGGGMYWQPFPKAVTSLYVQLGFQFGREAIHSDQELRFKVSPMLVKGKWRIGWAHISNARTFANLGNKRNDPIEWITIGYCASGCR